MLTRYNGNPGDQSFRHTYLVGKLYNHVWVEGNIISGERAIENDYPYNYGNDLHLRFKVLALGFVQPGQLKKVELPFANAGNKPMTLTFSPRNNNKDLQFTNPGKVAPNGRGAVLFTYAKAGGAAGGEGA